MISEAEANANLDARYGSGTPATIYLAAFISAPDADGTGGTEVTGGSYARKAVTNNSTNWPAAANAEKSLAVQHDFDPATADWGLVTHIKTMSASSGGDVYDWAELDTPREILNGGQLIVPADQLIIRYEL